MWKLMTPIFGPFPNPVADADPATVPVDFGFCVVVVVVVVVVAVVVVVEVVVVLGFRDSRFQNARSSMTSTIVGVPWVPSCEEDLLARRELTEGSSL